MPNHIRQIIVWLYSIFFVVVSSILLIYALGFRLDQQGVVPTSTVSISTLPPSELSSKLFVTTRATPISFELRANGNTEVSIQKEGFLSEKFVLSQFDPAPANSVIERLRLLPTQPQLVTPSVQKIYPLTASHNVLVTPKTNTIAIATNQDPSNIQVESIANQPLIIPLQLYQVGPSHFWDTANGLLIIQVENRWQILRLDLLLPNVISIAATLDSMWLVTDTQELYEAKLTPKIATPVFVENKADWVSYNPDDSSIWYGASGRIYRNLYTDSKNVSLINILTENRQSLIHLKNTQTGYTLHSNTNLWYIQAGNPDKPVLITDQALMSTTSSSGIYWLDKNNVVWYTDVLKGTSSPITQLKSTSKSLYYNFFLKRLLVNYTTGSSQVIWHDGDRDNVSISQYPVTELNASECIFATEGSILCSSDIGIVVFSNRVL